MLTAMGRDQDVPVWLTVISAGRPENVKPMTEMVGAATWYVPHNQRDEYFKNGANPLFGPGTNIAKDVPRVRNSMMADAFYKGAMCVQLDDDLKWAAFASNGKAKRQPPRLILDALVDRLDASDFKLAGAAPTNNAYFTRRQNSTNLFIRSGVIAIKKNPLKFDTRLPVKFDYDYTIQHWMKYGGVLRCDDLIFDFQQRSNKGGHVDQRSIEQEEAAIKHMLSKWPRLVKRHPRREHEVLLTLPRRKREVLS